MAKLRIGSRGSQLALWQANHVAALLRERGHEISIEIIKTTGDKITEVALSKVGTKGMFTKEIEEALAEQRIDLAVHSLKDLPTELAWEFALGAILPREDARDAFVSQKFSSLTSLPKKARVGTSSLRREAQLRAMRPDLQVLSLRGNVDTRLRKLESGEFEAIILAAAGLKRLGREEMVRERLPLDEMCPAAGQGALAIEVRAADSGTAEAIAFMDDAASRATTSCERALLNGLGGGCQVPIGAHAEFSGEQLVLTAVVASPDGTRVLRERQMDREAKKLGESVAHQLLGKGAQEILDSIYGTAAPAPEQP
ncbi:MAG: hydroxymethylbilane synthase [Terriglobales bacterium]